MINQFTHSFTLNFRKKLGIPIELIVHVEHDPVCVEVIKFNHSNDGIQHVFVQEFEDIYGSNDEPDHELLINFVGEHGPFDLAMSGAPCQNYSGLNSRRDLNAENAKYLSKVGKMVKRMNIIQSHTNDVKFPVLFLSENIVFKEHEDIGTSYSVNQDGLCLIRYDAKDFGPTKRNRLYWTNM